MDSTALLSKAKAIHDRVITLDTHIDINVRNFTDSINYTQRLDNQVNLPKMNEGGLDVAWFIVYTGQGELTSEGYQKAYENAMSKFEAIHRLTKEYAPEQIGLALTSDDVRQLVKEGKKVAMIGVENGYPIGTDLHNVKKFYDLGARYMSLAHNGHSQLADSNTGENDGVWLHNGLSELGKQVIAEMNKYGMMIDLSHPSVEANKQMIALSKAPVIASHSSARALSNHSRNLDDDVLARIKENGGVVQAVAFKSYVDTNKHKVRSDFEANIMQQLMDSIGLKKLDRVALRELDEPTRTAYNKKYQSLKRVLEKKLEAIDNVPEAVNVVDFVNHIDYLVDKIGIDHVGISSDFDGGGGIEGWADASETFHVTLELVKRGYTEEQIAKLWSGNLLRVLDEVQEVAKQIQAQS
ncbi:dipeptidase [Flavobacteriaceae bacterium F08102]|nr:dipeptidase [Flavobacteriaceae bacterium F08102]